MTKRQFPLIQFTLHAYIRRKTSALSQHFAIMLQMSCSDAIRTKTFCWANTLAVSTSAKIGFRYAKHNLGKFLKMYSGRPCSQQQWCTKWFAERYNDPTYLPIPYDANSRCNEIRSWVFSAHDFFRIVLDPRNYCHDAFLQLLWNRSKKLDQVSTRRDIPMMRIQFSILATTVELLPPS